MSRRFVIRALVAGAIAILLDELPILNNPLAILAANPSASEWDVLSAINPNLLSFQVQSVAVDPKNGAINDNKKRYTSVGMQRHSSKLIAYGILTKDIPLIDTGIKVIEYALSYQSFNGSFPNFLPEGGEGVPRSVSFFLQDIGRSLLLAQDSSWFQSSEQTSKLRARLKRVIPAITSSLNWLMSRDEELKKHDRVATNRIFFHALAYYLVGKALRKPDAMKMGEKFARMALKQQGKEGFFQEGKGYDTSYNGVSLQQALILYTNLTPSEGSLRQDLWTSIERSVGWQLKHFLPNGQLSTTGNTRIYSGGERFLGKTKTVDYVPLIIALNYYAKLSRDANVQNVADRAFDFYKESKDRTNAQERARKRPKASRRESRQS
jgi:hypothetical protein